MKTVFEKSRVGVSEGKVLDHEFNLSEIAFTYSPNDLNPQLGLPELTEVDVVRHYTQLSRYVHGVDDGCYPLGSCTMKYNPKRQDKLAELSGFRDVHPKQPVETMRGIWSLLSNLQGSLCALVGMDAVSLQPAAGAHGELSGLLMVRQYFRSKSEKRDVILIADSAHGTNPASASMAGFRCKLIETTDDGLMDIDALKAALGDDVAALMITNPSTMGLFEENILMIAQLVHDCGALLYYDGANLNALMGIVRPGDMGFDLMHLNTHKTLSTPHGGGGPGAGPIAVKSFLAPYLPTPVILSRESGEAYPDYNRPQSIGRMKFGYGHISILLRAYCYMITMGPDGLKQASENAVLNANYVQEKLRNVLPPVFDKTCMHECLLNSNKSSVSAYSLAKRIMDYGIHPPTIVGAGCVYYSDKFSSAMLIEPTETESRQSLDEMIEVFKSVLNEAQITPKLVEKAPYTSVVSRVELGAEELLESPC